MKQENSIKLIICDFTDLIRFEDTLVEEEAVKTFLPKIFVAKLYYSFTEDLNKQIKINICETKRWNIFGWTRQ